MGEEDVRVVSGVIRDGSVFYEERLLHGRCCDHGAMTEKKELSREDCSGGRLSCYSRQVSRGMPRPGRLWSLLPMMIPHIECST